jgi:hypothetical protein
VGVFATITSLCDNFLLYDLSSDIAMQSASSARAGQIETNASDAPPSYSSAQIL